MQEMPEPPVRRRHFSRVAVLLAVAPTAAISAAIASPSLRVADLAMLRSEYLAKEAALSGEARGQAEQLLARVATRAATKTDAEFVLATMQLTALANSGGSLVVQARPGAGQPRLPIRLGLFDDGLLIIRGSGAAKSLAGAKVLAIDGHSIDQVVRRLSGLFGGPPPRKKSLVTAAIEVPTLMHAAGIATRPDRLRLRLSMPGGRETEVDLTAVATLASGPGWWPDRWSADGFAGSDWSYANDGSMPLYLRDFERPVRQVPLTDDIQYLQIKWVAGWDPGTGLQDVKKALARAGAVKALVVDLRFDHGASSPEIANELKAMASTLLAPTRIFVLVGRYTHGDGIATAAALMAVGGMRATAVGEEMGDWLSGPRWAGRLCLKSVPICSTFSEIPQTANRADLRRPPPFAIVPAPPTAESLRNGTDPALDLVMDLARREPDGV